MRLHKRVEKLGAKRSPATELRTVHLVGVMPGETEEDACARYGTPIDADNDLIFLVGKEPEQ